MLGQLLTLKLKHLFPSYWSIIIEAKLNIRVFIFKNPIVNLKYTLTTCQDIMEISLATNAHERMRAKIMLYGFYFINGIKWKLLTIIFDGALTLGQRYQISSKIPNIPSHLVTHYTWEVYKLFPSI